MRLLLIDTGRAINNDVAVSALQQVNSTYSLRYHKNTFSSINAWLNSLNKAAKASRNIHHCRLFVFLGFVIVMAFFRSNGVLILKNVRKSGSNCSITKVER